MEEGQGKDLLKIFLIVFVVGFIFWYASGGPQKWENRMHKSGFKENIIEKVDLVK